MKDIIKKAEEYALSEIKIYGTPKIEHFEIANSIGQKLAKKLKVDKDLVLLGTILMDLKLGECFKEGKLPEHIERSSNAAKEFLKDWGIEEEKVKKIINCIEAHHGTKEYICKEAEICANADCYRFMHPRGVLSALVLWASRDQNLDNILEQIKKKFDEKQNILSLDICKKELKPHMKRIKKILDEASIVR